MSATDVVTVFLIHDGRILVLRRRGKAGADGDRWAGVRGDLGHDPRGQAYGDISEETGFGPDAIELLKEGEPLYVHDDETGGLLRVHPFLVAVKDVSALQLDREHVERRWVWPAEIDDLDTVPQLADALRRVYP